ncbi:MAG: DUF2249 domain-containing protein [Chthoniobacteraceae bacterium]
MPAPTITLDVREDLRAGREPFPRIMEAVGRLREGEQLRVIAPFEPHPLISVLAMQGFAASVTESGDGGFEVVFAPVVSAERDDDSLL